MTGTDPLATMLSRALGTPVTDARSEPLGTHEGVDRERVRFRTADDERTLVFERLSPRVALEAQLLPFLARKTDRVPAVHARGIPHSVTPAPPWVLIEDVEGMVGACDGDPRAIIEAKIAVEEAVRADVPALRALGVPERSAAEIAEQVAIAVPAAGEEAREAARRLAKWPIALVHGDLVCANAVTSGRGVVIKRWGGAYLGCALLDVVRLVADLVARDDAVRGIGLSRLYAERLGLVLPTEILRAAEKLEDLVRRLNWSVPSTPDGRGAARR
jgi:hypothetical protein